MQKHVQNYFNHFGYDKSSVILCECCTEDQAVDIHHIEPRSKFGSKTKHIQDSPDNLIALCRNCHTEAHIATRYYKERFKKIVLLRNEVKKLKEEKKL